ncbi:MAG: carbon-nitrogen hydrolase family protein [Xanthomonadaceae bacterium]|nr:carbon-nitrogen hydrolase family protein [Xanthomonadaceae bacterium]
MSKLKFVPVSMDSTWGDAADNVKKIKNIIEDTPTTRNAVFVFPELTLHGFVLENPGRYAICSTSIFHKQLSELARSHQCFLIIGGIEKNLENSDRPFNTTWVWNSSGKIIARYRKNNLFTQGSPSEKDLYSPGRETVIVDMDGSRVGLAICFDIRFPELFKLYEGKTDVVVLPACWVDGPDKENQLRDLSIERAKQTKATFVTVNRSGKDKNFSYSGTHYIVNPSGKIISETKSKA